MQKYFNFSFQKKINIPLRYLLVLFLIFLLFLSYFFVYLQPSNNRNWEVGFERQPKINIEGYEVNVSDIRNYQYSPSGVTGYDYQQRSFDSNKIKKVWFMVDPFSKFSGIAHTYFVFDFTDQDPVAISVEARREKGEEYSAFKGLFNQYELIYVWESEKDADIRRIILDKDRLYMYPLQISNEWAKKLFLQLAQTTQKLETQPRFYNTLTSNCTNELAKSADKVKPGAIPFDIALFLPGYSVDLLRRLGYIRNDLPKQVIEDRYNITSFIATYYQDNNFSSDLRMYLNR